MEKKKSGMDTPSPASDKKKALETAIAQIEKNFGKGTVMRLGDKPEMQVDAIPTGSLALDAALGIGGVPKGRIIEIYGPESSGKTTLALHIVAQAQKRGGEVAFVDAEHALDPDYAAAIGVDIDNMLVSQPDTGEQALEITDALVRSGAVDVVVVAACGERAGEVVEVLKEFPELIDPRTGRSLMERTIIICNTSSMPVAAREASVYTAVTIAEYYRQMGLDVLLLADSTSRWAQAMREMSGRLEEIPGEEAFPAYLESVIASFYERAGKVRLHDGSTASITIGGTVSPAGGNFDEPVTQATLKVVGAFHGLSRERSDARKYPSIHPIDSWSKYQGIVDMEKVNQARAILRRSIEVNQMMMVVGEEGTSAEDYIIYQKGELLDAVYLQQNSFDPIDAACSPERQRRVFAVIYDVLMRQYKMTDKREIRGFFNQLRQEFLDWHNTEFETEAFEAQQKKLTDYYLSKAV